MQILSIFKWAPTQFLNPNFAHASSTWLGTPRNT